MNKIFRSYLENDMFLPWTKIYVFWATPVLYTCSNIYIAPGNAQK